MKRIALLVGLMFTSSCAWIVGAGHGYEPPCRKSVIAPVVDTIVAGAAIAACVAGIASDASRDSSRTTVPGSLACVVPGLLAIPYGISAHYGYTRSGRCS